MSNFDLTRFSGHPQYPKVLEVCNLLKKNGYTAWLAGGCVRDYLLGIPAKDFDVATDAKPRDVQRIFPGSLDIGEQFGIIMVPLKDANNSNFQIEIATFRSDGEYKDGRRPEEVNFTTPEEDALRRDFTVNAMFYDPLENKLYDFVEGQNDLKLKILKAVGDPMKRFEEDKLRMLRAIRFSAQLDFEIEEQTFKAIQKKRKEITVVSKERIHQEVTKMMNSKALIRGLKYFKESHLNEVLFDSFKHFKDLDLRFEKSVQLLKNHKELDEITKWSLFFHPYFENTFNSLSAIEVFLKDYKFSGKFVDSIMYNFDRLKWMETFSSYRNGEVLEFIFSKDGRQFLSYYAELPHSPQEFQSLDRIIKLKNQYKELPEPLLNGNDLMDLGLKQGPQFKKILKSVYYHQLENKITDKEKLIVWTKAQSF
ncbi:MAG: CCA tRNA nucleotidyltransferase [Bdellovibrionota bacterium]